MPNYLVERRNGVAWKAEPTDVTQSGTAETAFNGVSCAGTSFCAAVGEVNDIGASLTDVWSGTTWHGGAQTFGGPANTTQTLNSVTCPLSQLCFAAGYAYRPKLGADVPLVVRYNGSTWTAQAAPLVVDAALSGIECVTATNCIAVGGRRSKPFALHWNGAKWSTQTVASVPGGRDAGFYGVACQSATSCWGIGDPSAATVSVAWSNTGTEATGRSSTRQRRRGPTTSSTQSPARERQHQLRQRGVDSRGATISQEVLLRKRQG